MSNSDLAELVFSTVNNANEKFRETNTGAEPEFMLSISNSNFEPVGGVYTPILNHWGFDSINYVTFGEGAMVLPWTHEDTFAYLTESDKILKDARLVFLSSLY